MQETDGMKLVKKRGRRCLIIILAALMVMIIIVLAGESGDDMQKNIGTTDNTEKTNNTEMTKDTEQTQVTYEHIAQDEAKNLMDSEPDYIILDVRTEGEYAEGHIPGAICIPNETIDDISKEGIDSMAEVLTDKEQLILVYCRSGNRSAQASQKLANMGYTNIKEFGGINTWPYDVEK